MAGKPGRPKSSESRRHGTLVRIDDEVAVRGKIAAAFQHKSLAEYFSDTLRPIIERDIDAGYIAGKEPAKPKSKPKAKGKKPKGGDG